MNFSLILGCIFGIAIFGLSTWLLLLIFKEQEEPTDDTIFKNFLSQYTNGYSYGTIIEIIKGENRTGIKFIPRDLDYVRLFKNRKKNKIIIQPQLIWIQNDKLLLFSKGILSARRHEIWGLPANAEDLSDEIKKHEFGKVLMILTEMANSKTEEVDILRHRIKVQNKLVEKSEGLEIVEDYMNKSTEITKDIIKNINNSKNKGYEFSGQPSVSLHS